MGRTAPGVGPRRGRRLLGLTATSVVAAAVVHWILDPGFPGRLGAVPFAVGTMLGFAAIVANANLQARAYVRRHVPEASLTWQVFPGQIAFSIVCVLISRLGHLVPGVFFGVAGDMVRNLDARHEQASWHGS